MAQCRKESNSLILAAFGQYTSSSQGVVLQRRHFHHALGSGRRKKVKRECSTEETQIPESDGILQVDDDDGYPVVNHKSISSEEKITCTDAQYVVSVSRKHRMRDQLGNFVTNRCKPKSTRLPSMKWNVMEEYSRVTLNTKSLQLGTLNMNFRGIVTFSVDYIEIPDKVRIAASELTVCEWCTEYRLPSIFLQTTAAEYYRPRDHVGMFTDTKTRYNFRSNSQKEKYIAIIFESEPTVLENAILIELFAEIGRLNNIRNFPAMLTFEEANDRLIANKQSFKKEAVLLLDEVNELPPSPLPKVRISSGDSLSKIATVNVLDSDDDDDDDDDLLVVPSSKTHPVDRLVVYPPPPAKGGFSITEEDLSCLEEGEFLNDVIVDFYLKYLLCEKLPKEDAHRWHVFSSFFYKSLTQKDQTDTTSLFIQERRHNRVKTWTRHLDLFEKDFIFVPINQMSHWYLAVICFPGQVSQNTAFEYKKSTAYTPSPSLCNPMSLFYRQPSPKQLSERSASVDDEMEDEIQIGGSTSGKVFSTASKLPCILIMDSLSSQSKPAVVKILQEYLEMEWWVKKGYCQSFSGGAMKGWSLQVPKQDNHTDCGIYLLQYVESFIANPPQISHPFMNLSDWFPQKLVKKKRDKIRKLIFRLHQQQLDSED